LKAEAAHDQAEYRLGLVRFLGASISGIGAQDLGGFRPERSTLASGKHKANGDRDDGSAD
jgi:hypothetical protein